MRPGSLQHRRGGFQTILGNRDDATRERTYPAPYPDSWYALARSNEVADDPVQIDAFGKSFVVFRTAPKAAVAVLDAHCPHMGANLALGTVVKGCVECPFHHWRFRGDGTCEHIPYAAGVSSGVATRAWPVEERYGLICVYYSSAHQSRGTVPPPPYGLPRYPEIDEGSLVYRGRHEAPDVGMHIIEFAENSADFRHFEVLHGDMLFPWTSIKIPGIRILHDASWEPDLQEPHVAWFRDSATLVAFGRLLPRTGARAAIRFHGPGGLVVFSFDIPNMGRILMFQTHTPIAPLKQKVRFTWYAKRRIPRILVSYVIGNWISQWRQDVRIWATKVYCEKPMVQPGDGPVHKLRRWYGQFYPEKPAPRVALPAAMNG